MRPTIIRRADHPVSRKQMSQEVLKVLYRLHRTGHLAYLCGGGVRDLLLRRQSGDFDVVTDAEPKRLKHIFRNCRLIGRRFRMAHIVFKGGKIIEVSTFRKKGEDEEGEGNRDSLLIKRDNTFGSPAEDAFRRDFTVNGLFYNVADFTVIDYVGGKADLARRLIRCIGNPDIRFQEDPIRILRGIRLAASLQFQVEKSTWEAMQRQRGHILQCPVSRVREEIMKILRRDGTFNAFELLVRASVLEFLFPKLDVFLRTCEESNHTLLEHFWQHLAVLDDLRSKGERLSDPLLLAALTATPMMASIETMPSDQDMGKSVHQYVEEYFKPLTIPRIVRARVYLLHLALRYMLTPKRKKRRRSLRRSPVFADALTLLAIHCRATQQHWSALARWQQPQEQRRPSRDSTKTHVQSGERLS
ncbi:MAG: polynucleotide adenylyltransferase PcnB [Deltaproteobacteria bacterium]|nr:MAG: polynucleotide adenylyltransferase PcnB [Deltaproteobacteria bacterium]